MDCGASASMDEMTVSGDNMNRFTLSSLALAALLAGCASSLPTVTDEQIATATTGGTLAATYDAYAAQLAPLDLNSPAGEKAKARLNYIGSLLADRLEKQIRQDINQNALPSGLIPIPVITRNLAKLPKMATWDRTRYQSLTKLLTDANAAAVDEVTAQQAALGKLTEYDLAPRLKLLDELGTLTGDARYGKERDDSLNSMQAKADAALKADHGEQAILALHALQGVSPNDPNITQQLVQANIKVFDKKFWDALADGRLDDAYTLFMGLSQTAEFGEVMKHLSKSTDDMASYFLAQASNALANDNMALAFKLLGQARDIRIRVSPEGAASQPPPQEQAFVDSVFKRYQTAAANGQSGLALGLLSAISAFQPDYPGIRPLVVSTSNQVLKRAILKVSTAAFTDRNGSTEVGGAVAAGVTKRLFDKIPQDIKIIEREQFEAILREQQLGNATGTGRENLAIADYLIEGKLTESRVDSSQENSKKTMRVVTETATVANPDYNTWLTMSESERKNYQEPPHTVAQEKKEDVTVNVQVVRKVGLISASYRLIEAKTGHVISTDTLASKQEFSDQGNEGVDLGDYHLPFKLASLPSDTEILQKLSDKVSEAIGDKIVAQLENPSRHYMQVAQSYADENAISDAVDQAANALVMAQQDKVDDSAIRKSLIGFALQIKPGAPAAATPAPIPAGAVSVTPAHS